MIKTESVVQLKTRLQQDADKQFGEDSASVLVEYDITRGFYCAVVLCHGCCATKYVKGLEGTVERMDTAAFVSHFKDSLVKHGRLPVEESENAVETRP